MKFVRKIQSLPPKQRKIILWAVMAITISLLFLVYIQKIKKILKYNKIENIKEELQIEELEKDLQNKPQF